MKRLCFFFYILKIILLLRKFTFIGWGLILEIEFNLLLVLDFITYSLLFLTGMIMWRLKRRYLIIKGRINIYRVRQLDSILNGV
jgi:hypothetical protein